jgi:aryl-alcohol dehydrogenase-like predicted oxidoreductase
LKQLEETKSFIGDYVKLYQIHSATFESGVLENKDVHAALNQCRKDLGWAIGLSVSSTKQNEVLRCAMGIDVEGCKLFDSVQCTYNMLEQKPGEALLEAHNAGMDIIIKEGLANGRIFRNPVVEKYAKMLSCSPDQLALAFILAQPFNPRVLSGAVTPDQLTSNLKAEELAEKLRKDSNLLKEIMESTVMDSEEYWTRDRALPGIKNRQRALFATFAYTISSLICPHDLMEFISNWQ